jgi:hypothetical protein
MQITAIPSPDGAQNHSPGFARAARTEAAHTAALRTAALLARTGFRVHTDDAFCARVRAAYEAGADAGGAGTATACVVTLVYFLSLAQVTTLAPKVSAIAIAIVGQKHD